MFGLEPIRFVLNSSNTTFRSDPRAPRIWSEQPLKIEAVAPARDSEQRGLGTPW